MTRTRVWVSVFRNSIIHKILSEFLQPFRCVGIIRVSVRDSHFYSVWVFWLVHATTLWCSRRIRVSPYLSIHTFAWHDCWRVIWMINFIPLKSHWSTHMSIHVHRRAFPAIKLLAYPPGVSLSRICPILWHTLWPLHSSALHNCLLWPSSDFLMSSRFPIQRNSNPFLLIICIDALESTTNSRSSSLRIEGESRHQFPESEKNVFLLLKFKDIYGQILRLLHGHIALVIPPLLETDP